MKAIANITFGLLEKGYNKLNKSKIFDSLKEALYYQNKYGGKIYTLDDVEYEEVDGRGAPKRKKKNNQILHSEHFRTEAVNERVSVY